MIRFSNSFLLLPFLLIILVTIPFVKVLLSDNPVGSIYSDTDLDYFLRLHNSSFNSSTSFPKWNPQEICGAPVLSEIQSGVFYPLNQLFRWVPIFYAVTLFFWFHIILISLFTYAFARQLNLSKPSSFLTSLTFTFSSHIVLGIYAGKLSNIATITWIPLLLALICKLKEKKQSIYIYAAIGFIFAIQLNGGHFQYFYYSLIFVFFFNLYRQYKLNNVFWNKKLIKGQIFFLGSVLFGICLCLPQLTAAYNYVQLTKRSALSINHCGQFSFPLSNIFTLVFPGIFGDLQNVSYWGTYNLWEMSSYCGIITFLLCIFAIYKKKSDSINFFLWAGLIALAIALGENTPLFKLLYNYFPGFSWFRGHSKVIIFFCLCIAILSGKGLDLIRSDKFQIRTNKNLILLLIFTFLGLIIILFLQTSIVFSFFDKWINLTINQPGQYLPIQPITHTSEGRLLAINFSIFSISKGIISILFSLWILYFCKKWTTKKRTFFIILIASIDLILFADFYIQSVDKRNFQISSTLTDFFNEDNSIYRVLDLTKRKFEPLSNFQVITGDRPYIWDRYTCFINMFLLGKKTASMKLPQVLRMDEGFNLMNVKYIIQKKNYPIPCKKCIRRFTDNFLDIYENTLALPRIFLAEQITMVNSPNDALNKLSNKDVLSGKNVIIEKKPSKKSIKKFNISNSQVKIVKYSNDEIIINTKIIEPAWLILLDSWSDGWQAICDEKKELDIYIANYLFRAVYIPFGDHEIKFIYLNYQLL